MADGSLVLCDALCFLINKFGSIGNKLLKPVLRDFYSSEALNDAKVRLLSDVNDINLSDKLPHIPQRRVGTGRVELEIDDLFTILTCLDEQKALDKLPKYVTSSLDNMPSLRLFEGDMSILMKLLKDGWMNMGQPWRPLRVTSGLYRCGHHCLTLPSRLSMYSHLIDSVI